MAVTKPGDRLPSTLLRITEWVGGAVGCSEKFAMIPVPTLTDQDCKLPSCSATDTPTEIRLECHAYLGTISILK